MRFEEIRTDVEIRASVSAKEYFMALAKGPVAVGDGVFAVVSDGNGTSVIAEVGTEVGAVESEGPLRIISFDTKLPFDLIGFLAYMTRLLADQGVSLFAISAFSADHILMKEVYLETAVRVLRDHGVIVDAA